MIPTDIVPPRVPGPAVSGVGQKAGNKGAAGREEVSFAHAMKKVAGDKDAAPQATAGDKPAKAGPLARWHRLELRGALSAGAENDAGEADAPGDGETGRDGEAEVSGEGVATQGTAHGMLSALSAHPHPQPHPHAVAAVTAPAKDEGNAKAARTVAPVDAEADAQAVQSAQAVKVIDVKVETHLGSSRREAAAAMNAEGLAHLGGLRQGEARKADASPSGPAPARDRQTVQKDGVSAPQLPAASGSQQLVAGLPEQAGQHPFRQGEGRGGADLRPRPETAEVRGPKAVEDAVAGPAPSASTPLQQIGPQITATAHEMKAAAAEAAASTASTPSEAGKAGPVRVLNIDLHPADLGSVSVRMSMHGDVLGVQIEAERPETARMLQSDQSSLSDMLRTAGLQVDGISVRAANMDTVSANTGSSQAYMQQSDSQSGGAQPDARASGGNGQGRDAQSFAGRQGERGQPDADRPQRGAGGGLYI